MLQSWFNVLLPEEQRRSTKPKTTGGESSRNVHPPLPSPFSPSSGPPKSSTVDVAVQCETIWISVLNNVEDVGKAGERCELNNQFTTLVKEASSCCEFAKEDEVRAPGSSFLVSVSDDSKRITPDTPITDNNLIFVQRMTGLSPVQNILNAYDNAKTYQFVGWALWVAERAAVLVTSPIAVALRPVGIVCSGPMAFADRMLCKSLDVAETVFPSFTAQSNKATSTVCSSLQN